MTEENKSELVFKMLEAFKESDERLNKLPQWKMAGQLSDGMAWLNKSQGLCVIDSISMELDKKAWRHVSVSRKSKIPSYEDLKLVHKLFIGEENTALHIFPKASKHVNIHKFCLHLWFCLDGDVTPDFTQGTGMI